MDGGDFQVLLDNFPATVLWTEAFPCACILANGQADRTCPICLGRGFYHGDPCGPFEVAITNQTAKERSAIAQTMGPGLMGDCTLIIFETAPCYCRIKEGDQIFDTLRLDTHYPVLLPGTSFRLPPMFANLTAMIKDGDVLKRVTPPIPDAGRVVTVPVTTRLNFEAPRGYQVILDFAQIRTFGAGLPKKLGLRLIDMSGRGAYA